MQHRVLANNDFAEAGYEGNVNFGPVIVKDGWQSDSNTDVRDKGENAATVQAGCSGRRTAYGGEKPPSGRRLRADSPADQTTTPLDREKGVVVCRRSGRILSLEDGASNVLHEETGFVFDDTALEAGRRYE